VPILANIELIFFILASIEAGEGSREQDIRGAAERTGAA